MEKYIEKAKVLMEAIPFIKEFYGKIVVIKYGGSAMNNENIKKTIMQDVVLMKLVGIHPVVVHGGGPEINSALKKIGKEPEFINGLRVTDKETMETVEMVLAGKINKEIVAYLQNLGGNAAGICGKDGNTLLAEKKLVEGNDVGFVGEITHVNTSLLNILIENDFIPVISPIGTDNEGNTYNINADYAAVAIAGALKARKLVFLTDVAGVLRDVNDSNSLIHRISIKEVPHYIREGIISGGMIPKIECCVAGVKEGVETVHITDGRVEHCLILEIFTGNGIGTMVEE